METRRTCGADRPRHGLHAPREYPPPDRRYRATRWREKYERVNGTLTESEKRAWLRLARTPTIGPASFAALIARAGSARAALDEVPRLASRGGGNVQLPSDADAEREIAAIAKLGGKVLASCEPEY